MKKWLLASLLLLIGISLVACSSNELNGGKAESEEKEVFTKSDIKKAEEMIVFLDEKMKEFESKANSAVKNGEISSENESVFDDQVRSLANELVTQPFIEKYEGGIVPEEFKGEEQILVYFNKTNSEPCSLNFCKYDGIEVMNLEHDFQEREEYTSVNFQYSELVINGVSYDYKNDDKEVKNSSIRFVKDESDQLILTQHPYLSITTLNFQEYDKEFESIATDVPESEVEAEQAEYKKEVQETLAKFPELQ